MKAKTYFIVQYNDRYGNGDNKMFECIVENKTAFNNWLKEHNRERRGMGAKSEKKEEFNLIPINLFSNP